MSTPRKPPPGKSLAEVNPELAKEWHPTRNGDLTPYDVSSGATKKVWWKCHKGDDHEWESTTANRSNGKNCPICSGHKTVISNCLATTRPDLAIEWHPIKNGDLKPVDLGKGSGKKVWWKCPKGPDHEWEESIVNRSKNNYGCTICSGRKIVESNSLSVLCPDLAKEWHPLKNKGLLPTMVGPGSNKKVWWKCPGGDDHEWESNCNNRSYDVSSGVTKGRSCPYCSGKKVSKSMSFGVKHPELLGFWDHTRNGNLTPFDFMPLSNKKVWWKCPEGNDHEWKKSISVMIRFPNCKFCNSLKYNNPEFLNQWHPTKNSKLDSNYISINSGKKVWWKCDKGDDHEWIASVDKRTNGSGCPVCSNYKVVKSNCILTTHQAIAKEWHPTKNTKLSPENVTAGSHNKVWWQCHKGEGHEWITSIVKRTSGQNCPFCTLTPQSRQELIITFELLTIFKGINPKGFKTRVNGKLRSIDTFIPSLNVGIEFDGAYWHKDKAQLDKMKTEQIEETGLNLIRVRQKPLERLFEDDVMAEEKFDGKQITNDILKQIVTDNGKYSYTLDKRTLNKIDKYINKEGLQNEKGLDKYIDQILTEKAERKKVK